MVYEKTNFIGSWPVASSSVQFLLKAANNRGQQAFNALAPFGQTTSTPPLLASQMAQTYVLPDLDAVETFLASGVGPRGSEFLNALALVQSRAAADITDPGVGATVAFSLSNFFPAGTEVIAEVILFRGGLTQEPLFLPYVVTVDSEPELVAEAIAAQWNGPAHPEVLATHVGAVVTLAPNTGEGFDNEIGLFRVIVTPPNTSANDPAITKVSANGYQITGMWMGGAVLTFALGIVDPDGDMDEDSIAITLPPGEHTGEVVASVVANVLEERPYIRAAADGNILELSATTDGYILTSSVQVS